jgi:branched-chain amino acid transport system substrate-binding protein
MAVMRKTPVSDFMTQGAKIREDGRLMRDMYLMEAKKPSESRGDWDLMKIVATIPGEKAYRAIAESECPLIQK